jgi:hypothetical protein
MFALYRIAIMICRIAGDFALYRIAIMICRIAGDFAQGSRLWTP